MPPAKPSKQSLQGILLSRAQRQKAFNGSLSKSYAHFVANFQEAGSWSAAADDPSSKPALKENIIQEYKLEVPVTPMQKQFKSRPDAPIFIPSNSNGSTNMPEVFSVPTRGRGGSVRISAPSLSIDVAFKPLIINADEISLIELDEPNGVNQHEANTVSSSIQSFENAGDLSSQISQSHPNENKGATEENCGPLIQVTKSGLKSNQTQASTAEDLVSTDVFFGPLKEISKPPHRRAVASSHPVASKRYVPTDIDFEATALHGLNLVVIKDFARRAEALRQGDTNAIQSTGKGEEEGYDPSLPAVSDEIRAFGHHSVILLLVILEVFVMAKIGESKISFLIGPTIHPNLPLLTILGQCLTLSVSGWF